MWDVPTLHSELGFGGLYKDDSDKVEKWQKEYRKGSILGVLPVGWSLREDRLKLAIEMAGQLRHV